MGGFLDAMLGGPHQIMPVVWTAACPSAHVTEDTFERITETIVEAASELHPDAVYLDIHGAMVTEHLDDGELLNCYNAYVRWLVLKFTVVGSLDLHANVTELMLKHSDALSCLPHLSSCRHGENRGACGVCC